MVEKPALANIIISRYHAASMKLNHEAEVQVSPFRIPQRVYNEVATVVNRKKLRAKEVWTLAARLWLEYTRLLEENGDAPIMVKRPDPKAQAHGGDDDL